jgi:hypothetical protein
VIFRCRLDGQYERVCTFHGGDTGAFNQKRYLRVVMSSLRALHRREIRSEKELAQMREEAAARANEQGSGHG